MSIRLRCNGLGFTCDVAGKTVHITNAGAYNRAVAGTHRHWVAVTGGETIATARTLAGLRAALAEEHRRTTA